MTDTRSVVAVALDLHKWKVTPELVECACGWLCKRGPGSTDKINEHLTDEITQTLLDAGLQVCNGNHWRKITPEEEDENSALW